ncbi:MAG: hypothetical protein RIS29_2034 [Bacteroidota bacterium]|jgi:hypothetical protein
MIILSAKMKKILLFLMLGCVLIGQAQVTSMSYKIKADALYGTILPFTERISSLIDQPVTGAEVAVEWQTVGEKRWHYYLNFPMVGVAATYLNLGNPEKLGNAFALYPYMNFGVIRNKYFNAGIKAGAGVSYLTKTYYNTNTDANGIVYPSLDHTNSEIGSHLNVYFAGGGSLEVPLLWGLSLSAELTWNHMSNGSVIAPNGGLNLINAMAGLKYSPNYRDYRIPAQRKMPEVPRKFSTELIVSGGVRQLYYKDKQSFGIGSIDVAEFYPLTNYYRMGVGADLFFDPVFGEVNSAVDGNAVETSYKRTYITKDVLWNKLRAGISWQNELIIDRLTAGIHLGLYLYDPIKNKEPYTEAANGAVHKGLFYGYDISKEDGWLYSRASLKYAITNHVFAAVGLKTHLQKAEFIEWGLGYKF